MLEPALCKIQYSPLARGYDKMKTYTCGAGVAYKETFLSECNNKKSARNFPAHKTRASLHCTCILQTVSDQLDLGINSRGANIDLLHRAAHTYVIRRNVVKQISAP